MIPNNLPNSNRPKAVILELKNVSVSFETDDGRITAVDRVSFQIMKGEILGLVGESGCGKSVTALSILRLIPYPSGKIDGSIFFQGKDLLTLSSKELQKIRGRQISMIFQEPGAALSPLHTIGNQLVETILIHQPMNRKLAWDIAKQWLSKVGISDPVQRMHAYPHQLSGGMQQRVMIAMALMMEPQLVIADEPTTALDVTIQAQIFDLIQAMRTNETSVLLITHNLGVVWEMCDRVIVMYASRIVEQGYLNDIFNHPAHPYTRGLLQSIPKLSGNQNRLNSIPGQVPTPYNYPKGCRFHDRCPHTVDRCKHEEPPLIPISPNHQAACFMVNT